MRGDLYSADLQQRYKASVKGGNRTLKTRWPVGCGGAANAFRVLVGPSVLKLKFVK